MVSISTEVIDQTAESGNICGLLALALSPIGSENVVKVFNFVGQGVSLGGVDYWLSDTILDFIEIDGRVII